MHCRDFFFNFSYLKLSYAKLIRELERGQCFKRIKSDTSEWVEYTEVTRECD